MKSFIRPVRFLLRVVSLYWVPTANDRKKVHRLSMLIAKSCKWSWLLLMSILHCRAQLPKCHTDHQCKLHNVSNLDRCCGLIYTENYIVESKQSPPIKFHRFRYKVTARGDSSTDITLFLFRARVVLSMSHREMVFSVFRRTASYSNVLKPITYSELPSICSASVTM